MLKKLKEGIETIKADPLATMPVPTKEQEEYIKDKGISLADYSNALVIIEQDMEALTWNKDDEIEYMMKAREITNRLHGIYNQQDKTAFQQQWFG